ncbi:acyl-(acyl-carrier-protein)--UDP-N-acetylglucosa mineO-acyltransferase [Isosphaera pallida ATCC 43644]|uniref:Acyl-(Acyl-carrier-protein)--UDP-N-acetylglucosa mineO-acyltransferase n=1 Tax=Isosphaera pallida (strain ATCC 43644 / DSM 9630 / IS1B) TaxID=575540 RepID=E8R1S0_ISOPI|nr:acyl-ACP--UDP-N-acetylglucosamine O-acyltransferase [Isosphaera pallida]ADV61342.1 acyl-(acyl-carrier-protein)--UDP-N-acetylglucosa mineO-acyltransferase [Isosphaera pallida ATCC 43644]
MATLIADTASVDPRAVLGDGVEIGPYCVIGPQVEIGPGTRLIAHVCVPGPAVLGARNVVHPFSVLGGDPQDISYRGEPTRLVIGDDNVIREHVTINRGTAKDQGLTAIGHRNLLMAGVHVAHDCQLGDDIVLANGTLLGGHVHIEDQVGLSGGVAVHHYVTIGRLAFIGGHSRIIHDVPPYMLVDGNPSRVRCINIVGLRRHGLAESTIDALHEAHRLIFRGKMTIDQAAAVLESQVQPDRPIPDEVTRLLEFLRRQQSGRHGRGRELARGAGASSTSGPSLGGSTPLAAGKPTTVSPATSSSAPANGKAQSDEPDQAASASVPVVSVEARGEEPTA